VEEKIRQADMTWIDLPPRLPISDKFIFVGISNDGGIAIVRA
jgi:hypothetical protein